MEDYTGKVVAIGKRWGGHTLLRVTKQTSKMVFGHEFGWLFSEAETKHVIANAHVVVMGGGDMTDEQARDIDRRINRLRSEAWEKERAIAAEYHAAVEALGKAGE